MRRTLSLGAACAALALACALVPAAWAQAPVNYEDAEYGFGFQYPDTWKKDVAPKPGEGGEVRAIFKHPTLPVFVAASVGQLGYKLSRKQYLDHKDREKLNASLLDWVRVKLYRTTAVELGAGKLQVAREEVASDDVGIQMYLATAGTVGEELIAIAGRHVVPFGKGYIVNFILVSPADIEDEQENVILHHVFNSFHVDAAAK